MGKILTNLSFIEPGNPWPPKGEAERLQTYEDNKNLFEGMHEKVYKDWDRLMREDSQTAMRMIFNWPKRISTLWADLLWGEPPNITAGDPDTAEQLNLERIVKDNDLHSTGYETTLDKSRFGVGLFKVRFDKRAIIEAQPPSCWFPVVNPVNVKEYIAHVLAWTWTEDKVVYGAQVTTKYLQVEIHEKGKITTRRYTIDGSTIGKQIALDGVQEEVFTGIDDFLVIPDNNLMTSERSTGLDDYSDIDSILQEMEVRVSQIARILDKHSDPNMFGPESALIWDPDTHQYSFKGGGNYFPCEIGDQQPGYLIWDGQLIAAFTELDRLQQQLYILTETSPAAFGELKAGLAESGTALKRLMMATLAKVNRMRMGADNAVKKVLQTAAALEVAQGGVKGACKLEEVHIEWADGLPLDEREQATIDNENFISGTASLESVLKRRGLTGDRLQEELNNIKGAQAAVEPPNINLGGE